MSENTENKQRPEHLFKPGQSGNPAGRPKGARSKLGEAFTQALYADFQQHGVATIERVRVEDPAQYVRVVAGLLPKEVKIDSAPLSDMSDDELGRLIDILRAAVAAPAEADSRTETPQGPQSTGGVSSLH